MNFKNLNTAESITLIRIAGFPLILLFTYFNNRPLTAWLFIILFSSDFIDGFFAFFFDQESPRRAILDTWGDILLLSSGVLAFYHFEKEFFLSHLLPIGIVLGLYLILLFLGIIKWGKASSFHTFTAKLAAIAQVFFLGLTLLFEASTWLFYFAVTLSILDALEDIILVFLLPRWQANIKSVFLYKRKENSSDRN